MRLRGSEKGQQLGLSRFRLLSEVLAGNLELCVAGMKSPQALLDFYFLRARIVFQTFDALLLGFDVAGQVGVLFLEHSNFLMLL
jgi:hypothetical protein